MNTMQEIVKELEGDASEAALRFLTTRSGWDAGNFETPEVVLAAVNEAIEKQFRPLSPATRHSFIVVKKSGRAPWAYRGEEALERMIILANKLHCAKGELSNQFNLQGVKENTDLVIKDNNKVVEIIELKPWDSQDNPMYGVVELIKNLQLGRRRGKFGNDLQTLTLLAPMSYYEKYSKSISDLKRFIAQMEKSQRIHISLKALGVGYSQFRRCIKKLCVRMQKVHKLAWIKSIKTARYDFTMTVTPNQIDIKDIRETLLYRNWEAY